MIRASTNHSGLKNRSYSAPDIAGGNAIWAGPGALYTQLSRYALAMTFMLVANPSGAASVESYFDKIKYQPNALREFLSDFPKGGELHTHLDGAVYAENYIAWAAADGKCIDLDGYTITMPPCDASQNRPRVADVQMNADLVNPIIDAFSMRNYERGDLSGHDQFFATFSRYLVASFGRTGSMLAEMATRAARQNVLYLEIMASPGMAQARDLAAPVDDFKMSEMITELSDNKKLDDLIRDTVVLTDKAELSMRTEMGCDGADPIDGCDIEIRYIAQVIRVFPLEQVLAQTLFAFKLMESDPRFVGINFVAPEDAPITLRDYTAQMQIIASVSARFPELASRVTLHAGELASPLVAPKELRFHINEAVRIAGATRIGHGVDILHETDFRDLLDFMAKEAILVEINLTSNDVILGVAGDEHPFMLYRSAGVPLALSTDDEGVSRIDLTHEYVRATRSYDLSYAYLKELSRNSLAYSYLSGENLFSDIRKATMAAACKRDRVGRPVSESCTRLLATSEKARLQWELEERFERFETQYE